ncbi:MAG: ABC transporter ATP-binding protein [Planctomycetota bacterium]
MTKTAAQTIHPAAMAIDEGRDSAGGKVVLACQNLSKVFKDFWLRDRARAVDGVSFEIRRGEVFGLLGPNGSGKSTTIKMVLGLLRPSGGRVVVLGKPPSDVKVKKRIGYLPEESYLYGFLDARETLDYYGKLFELDSKTRERRIDELLEMVGLTHAQHRPVRDYSKGMQRRIGIAQALINDPDFLILDEPTTGLDPIGTRQVKDLIIELGRRGKTVLLSSHLLADVEDVVDRMVILYGGKIRDEGTVQGLLTAANKTTIEADDLDEETLAEIDELIRRRSSGEKSVLRVSRPRQKLEELFLDIVARAQQERAATSGATHTAETAAFLRSDGVPADDAPAGDELIRTLVSDAADDGGVADQRISDEGDAGDGVGMASDAAHESAPPSDAVLEDLLTADDEPVSAEETERRPVDHAKPARDDNDVDEGVIGSLLRGGDSSDDGDRRQ